VDDLLYPVQIRPLSRSEGGGYLATVPDLPGCMYDGETSAEALANVHEAIAAWKDRAEKMGRPAATIGAGRVETPPPPSSPS
jgi:predicted RNase H-like HicB family nuclease